jgi:hypothetical protein
MSEKTHGKQFFPVVMNFGDKIWSKVFIWLELKIDRLIHKMPNAYPLLPAKHSLRQKPR